MILCSGIVELFGQTNTGGKFPQLLFPDFNKGIVQMKTGKTNSALLDYNTVDEEMLIEQNGGCYVLSKPEDIDTIYLQNRKFIPFEKVY